MLKVTVFSPAVLLAAMMASRSDTLLSVPLLALSCSTLNPVPRPVSLVSAVVSTTSVVGMSSTVMAMSCWSSSRLSLAYTVTL